MAEVASRFGDQSLSQVLANLIERTQKGKITWTSQPASPLLKQGNPDEHVDVVFTAEYKGHRFLLYRLTYKSLEYPSVWGAEPGEPPDSWRHRVVLAVTDESGRPLWTFPTTRMLSDLLNAVGYQVADVTGAIESLLDDD